MEVSAGFSLPHGLQQRLQRLIGSLLANLLGTGLIQDQLFQLSRLCLWVEYKCDASICKWLCFQPTQTL